jgi:hypothetical protein
VSRDARRHALSNVERVDDQDLDPDGAGSGEHGRRTTGFLPRNHRISEHSLVIVQGTTASDVSSREGARLGPCCIGGMMMTERRGIYLSIGLVTLGVLACAAMAGSRVLSSPPRDLGRMVVTNELLRIHWKSFATSGEEANQRALIEEMATQFMPVTVDYDWTVRFVARSADIQVFKGQQPDKLEEAAISEIENGVDEVWQGLPDGTWRLVTALRSEGTCRHCHHRREDAPSLLDDGPLGYASVKLVPRRIGNQGRNGGGVRKTRVGTARTKEPSEPGSAKALIFESANESMIRT